MATSLLPRSGNETAVSMFFEFRKSGASIWITENDVCRRFAIKIQIKREGSQAAMFVAGRPLQRYSASNARLWRALVVCESAAHPVVRPWQPLYDNADNDADASHPSTPPTQAAMASTHGSGRDNLLNRLRRPRQPINATPRRRNSPPSTCSASSIC